MLLAAADRARLEAFGFAMFDPLIAAFGHGDARTRGGMDALLNLAARGHRPGVSFLAGCECFQMPFAGLVEIVANPSRPLDPARLPFPFTDGHGLSSPSFPVAQKAALN